jgi:hypothetical protein
MRHTKSIKVQQADGSILDGTIELIDGPPCHLVFSAKGIGPFLADGEDLFDALTALRLQLESCKCLLLCAGARTDVSPSGMSRGMSGGRKAYVTHIGKPALKNDVVDIFDYAGPDVVGTVDQQMAYHKKWTDYFRS